MVEVSQESDFGTAVGSVITLTTNTTYFVRGSLSCTHRLLVDTEGVAIIGWDRDKDGLNYTSSGGDFITIDNVNCELANIKLSSTNSISSSRINSRPTSNSQQTRSNSSNLPGTDQVVIQSKDGFFYEGLRKPKFANRESEVFIPVTGETIVTKKCEINPIEFVVRGYMTGTTQTAIWQNYQKVCAVANKFTSAISMQAHSVWRVRKKGH